MTTGSLIAWYGVSFSFDDVLPVCGSLWSARPISPTYKELSGIFLLVDSGSGSGVLRSFCSASSGYVSDPDSGGTFEGLTDLHVHVSSLRKDIWSHDWNSDGIDCLCLIE